MTNVKYACLVCVISLAAFANQAQGGTITWDFENGDMLDTTGNLAFTALSSGFEPDVSFLNNPVLYSVSDSNATASGGTYLVRSDFSQTIPFNSRSDGRTGVMQSGAFLLEASANLSYESSRRWRFHIGSQRRHQRAVGDPTLDARRSEHDCQEPRSQRPQRPVGLYPRHRQPDRRLGARLPLTTSSRPNASIVPEPHTCSLLLFGMSAIVWGFWRRKRA